MSVRHLYLESVMIHSEEAKLLSNFIRHEDCMLEELEINEADIDVAAIDEIMEALY
jgi:septation ring formation regulator EzrA